MKHPLREILAHFAAHVGHTHEAAVQATYDLGHATGREEAKAEFAAGVGDSLPAASTGASDEKKDDGKAGQDPAGSQDGETTEEPKT